MYQLPYQTVERIQALGPGLETLSNEKRNKGTAVRFVFSCTVLVILGVSVVGCGNSNPTLAPTSTLAPTPTPTSTPTTFTLSGLVTDGTSGGVLPNIDVLIMNGASQGQDLRTDSAGHYSFTGVSNGTFNVQFSAVSYVTQNVSVTVAGNTTENIILQRTGA
jgi:hypothetical protein